MNVIFPWVDTELSAYQERLDHYGSQANDYSLKNVLLLLRELRTILLQDAAVLYAKYPNFRLWDYAPFNTDLFLQFSQSSNQILERAEEDAQQKLAALPHVVARSMEGILRTIAIQRQQDNNEAASRMEFFAKLTINNITSTGKGRKVVQDSNFGTCPTLIVTSPLFYSN